MRKYTKEEIIGALNNAKNKGDLLINGTVDSIFSSLDLDKSDLKLNDNLFDIKHPSFLNLLIKNTNVYKMLFSCSDMKGLTKNIINISEDYQSYGYSDKDGSDKLKGDLFEIFAEIFFKLTSSDSRVGITDYTPEKSTDDYGVDGYGIAMNQFPCTVQVKFRSNPTESLTIKDLKNFQGLSYRKYKVPVESSQNLIVFTNCSGVHWNTETKVMENAVITFASFTSDSNHSLNSLLDNNYSFWKNVDKLVDHNISKFID